jgi:hypothetical protein
VWAVYVEPRLAARSSSAPSGELFRRACDITCGLRGIELLEALSYAAGVDRLVGEARP